jgi:uncharacterized membrane protein
MDVTPAASTTRIADDRRLDGAVDALSRVADRVLADPRVRSTLRGEWLGHPLHPMLTDLPVGFWTSAFVLDLGGRRWASAADAMVGAGLLTVLPTAAAGLADWRTRDRRDRRVGIAHAGANLAATVLYAGSLGHRLRGHRLRGIALGMAGAAAATVGGYLGGHLAFGAAEQEPAADGIVDQQGSALAAVARPA